MYLLLDFAVNLSIINANRAIGGSQSNKDVDEDEYARRRRHREQVEARNSCFGESLPAQQWGMDLGVAGRTMFEQKQLTVY